MPIERVNLTTYSPDSLTNNPAILTDGGSKVVFSDAGAGQFNKEYRSEGTYNVYPTTRGYKTLVDASAMFAKPEAGVVKGAYVATYLDGSTAFFVGTPTKLWSGVVSSGATTGEWTDKSGSTYSDHGAVNRWHFAQLGDRTIAVANGNTPQSMEKGGSNFAAISGAPNAKFVTVANNFVVLANLEGASTPSTNKEISVWVSGFGKYDYWTTGDQNLSEFFALSDTPGEITGVKAIGRNVYVYKLRATHILTFSSGWSNNLVSTQAGAVSNDAVVDLGERHVSMGYDNFYSFESGGGASSLENPLYEKIFGRNGDLDRTSLHLVQGRYDRVRGVVFWHYPSVNRITPNYCDKWVAWGVGTERWAIGETPVAAVVYPNFDTNPGTTYSDFGATTSFRGDTGSAALTWGSSFKLPTESVSSSAVNTLTYTDGSIVGTAGYVSGYVDCVPASSGVTAGEVKAYAPLLSATPETYASRSGFIQTGDFGDGVTYKFLRKVRPRFVTSDLAGNPDGPSIRTTYKDSPDKDTSLTVLSRNDLDEDWTVVSSTTIGESYASRWFTLRGNARYFKFIFEFYGQEISGFDIDYEEGGIR